MPKKLGLVLVALALLMASCGGGGSPTAPASVISIAGTWDVTGVSTPGGAFADVLALTQTGADVSGTGNAGGGLTITGTVQGSTFSFTFRTAAFCEGSFTGSAAITQNASRLEGSHSGSWCLGRVDTIFTATRR